MKKFRCFAMMSAACFAFAGMTAAMPVYAEHILNPDIGEGLSWDYDTETGTLTISGTGYMYNLMYMQPWYYDFENIQKIVVEEGVKNIGAEAFDGCINLTEVILPSTLESIDMNAFASCKSLVSITIPDGVGSIDCGFQNSGLENVVIPKSVETIGMCAFSECEALETITIENPECQIEELPNTICNGFIMTDEDIEYVFTGTIYGYEGSTAQAYAETYGYKFAVIGTEDELETGDLNDDGDVGIEDAMVCLQWATELIAGNDLGLTTAQIAAADIDGDGEITAVDAVLIMAYYVNNVVAEKDLSWDDIRSGNF